MKSLLTAITLVFSINLVAQPADPPKPVPVDKQVSFLKTKLNLTADQEKKVREILEKAEKEREALNDQMKQAKEETKKQVSDRRKGTNDEIEAVLTPEQKKEWEAIKEKRKERWEEKKGKGKSEKHKDGKTDKN